MAEKKVFVELTEESKTYAVDIGSKNYSVTLAYDVNRGYINKFVYRGGEPVEGEEEQMVLSALDKYLNGEDSNDE